jgi:hypothetical protein
MKKTWILSTTVSIVIDCPFNILSIPIHTRIGKSDVVAPTHHEIAGLDGKSVSSKTGILKIVVVFNIDPYNLSTAYIGVRIAGRLLIV